MPSCNPESVHEGDVVRLRLRMLDADDEVVDVSVAAGVTSMSIKATGPDGTTFSGAATYVGPPDGEGDGTDGFIELLTSEGQLSPAGPGWRYQGTVEFATGPVHSGIETFEVLENLP